MTHLYIELNTGLTEEVNSSIISKLYELAISGDLDNTSDLKGRLHTTACKDIHYEYLTGSVNGTKRFPDLYITADNLYISFVDSVAELICESNWGTSDGVTNTQLQAVVNNDLTANGPFVLTNIVNFPEFSKFTGVTKLNYNAFLNCTQLQSITLPSSCTELGRSVFHGDTALSQINLSNIESIDAQCFLSCSSLSGTINLPNLTTIKDGGVFNGCSSIQEINLGSNLQSIPGGNMFYGCTSLTKVTGLYNMTSIQGGMFDGCRNLVNTDLDFSNVTNIEGRCFYDCISYPFGDLSLSSVTSIGKEAFRQCTGITKLTLNDNVSIAGDNAFWHCTNMTLADLGSGITFTSGGHSMFSGCTGLTTVTGMSGVSSIPNYMFTDCTNLSNIDINPLNVTNVGDYSFYNCTSLSSFGNKMTPTYIGNKAFENCTHIDNNDIDLSAATHIGNNAMQNTTISGVLNLTECLTLGENPFGGCIGITEIHAPKLTDFNMYSYWINYSNLEVLDLPVSTRINYVQNNPKLTTINAPLATKFSTYDDGKCSFCNCPLLSTLNINFSAITTLGSGCFVNDTGLNGQYLYFPNVTSFEAEAIRSNAINFVFSNNSIITLTGYGWFSNYTGTVYVPDNLVNTYKTTSEWSSIANLIKGISELPNS